MDPVMGNGGWDNRTISTCDGNPLTLIDSLEYGV